MRDEFHAELREVSRLLVAMATAVRTAMSEATTALLHADQPGAEAVIGWDSEVDLMYRQVEQLVCDLLARQAPVASDLRAVVSALQISGDLERMGDLACHVARTAVRRYPAAAVPVELIGVIGQMAQVADRVAEKVVDLLGKPDADRAAELERDDDAMDELERRLFGVVLDRDWPHGVEAAVDGALLARFYERYADHAVNTGNRVVYLVTGEPATD